MTRVKPCNKNQLGEEIGLLYPIHRACHPHHHNEIHAETPATHLAGEENHEGVADYLMGSLAWGEGVPCGMSN